MNCKGRCFVYLVNFGFHGLKIWRNYWRKRKTSLSRCVWAYLFVCRFLFSCFYWTYINNLENEITTRMIIFVTNPSGQILNLNILQNITNVARERGGVECKKVMKTIYWLQGCNWYDRRVALFSAIMNYHTKKSDARWRNSFRVKIIWVLVKSLRLCVSMFSWVCLLINVQLSLSVYQCSVESLCVSMFSWVSLCINGQLNLSVY